MPYHTRRTWCVGPVESAESLAEKLVNHSWTLCTGFRLGDYLFLNDSTGEDRAQEYAVVKDMGNGAFLQVESITFSWMHHNLKYGETAVGKALEYIRATLAGKYDANPMYKRPSAIAVETPQQHGRCHLCA